MTGSVTSVNFKYFKTFLRERKNGVSQNNPEQQTGLPDLAVAGKEVQPRAATPIARPLVAELVGTFSFFFIGAGAIITNTMTHGAVGLPGIAVAHGLALAIMVSIFGATSGGHFNPAVTLGFLATRRITPSLAGVYILAQLTGGVFAGLVLRAIFTESVWGPVHLGTPYLSPNISFGTGVLVEAILTGILLLAVFCAAVEAREPT